MSDEQRLAEIRSRADAATPGPWLVGGAPNATWQQVYCPRDNNLNVVQSMRGGRDASFVAHAREDIPWLLDLVRQQARVIADLQEESDAARLALRYREALERIAAEPQRLSTVMSVAREALEGKP